LFDPRLDDPHTQMFLTSLINQPSRVECPDCRILFERRRTACPNCGRRADAEPKPVAKRTELRRLALPR
jgi:predicted amidophosphoribosyltransferase